MSFSALQKQIINKNLCTRCGSCAGICPAGNITFRDRRGVCLPADNQKCLENCTLCSKVCPGAQIDLSSRSATNGLPFRKGLGAYQNIQLLRASVDSIRDRSTSGGAVTALLMAFMDMGYIHGVIALGPDKTDPTMTGASIAYNNYDILSNIQSRYCVSPLNEALNGLEKNKKYALVGLPCMIDGLYKMMKIKKELQQQIVITLGLFCHSTMPHSATRELLRCVNVQRREPITEIKYRQGDFPGGFQAKTRERTTLTVPLADYMILFNYHSLDRCRLCVNHYNAFADLAFADPFPFLDELGDDHKWTVTLARTPKAGQFVRDALEQTQHINARAVSTKNIEFMNKKHRTIQQIHLNQVAMNKKLGRPTPDYGLKLPDHGFGQAIFNLIRVRLFKDIMLSSRAILRRLKNIEFIDPQYRKLQRFK